MNSKTCFPCLSVHLVGTVAACVTFQDLHSISFCKKRNDSIWFEHCVTDDVKPCLCSVNKIFKFLVMFSF